MKGHSKIELTDVNTGDVEVFEDDNLITNALQMIINGFGTCCLNPIGSKDFSNYELWKSLLGGILLFGENIEEDVNNVTLKTRNTMIGNGFYNYASTSDVTELGSWNDAESGIQDDGTLKLVYDFSTAQSNGMIKCVCLTSSAYGSYGDGNVTSGKYLSNLPSTPQFMCDWGGYGYNGVNSLPVGSTNDAKLVMFLDWNENSYYIIDYYSLYYKSSYSDQHFTTTGSIHVKKYRFGLSKVCVFDGLNNPTILDEFDVQIPDEVKQVYTSPSYCDTNGLSIYRNENSFFIIFARSGNILNVNSQFYVLKIDGEFKTTLYTVTNNSGVSLRPYYSIGISNEEYLYTYNLDSPYPIFKINLKDSTDITKLQDNYLSSYVGNQSYYFSNNKIHAKYLILDCYTDRIYYQNFSRGVVYMFNARGNDLITLMANSTLSYPPSLAITPFYLATINNLSEPVTKTEDKTMKVTYTLTMED